MASFSQPFTHVKTPEKPIKLKKKKEKEGMFLQPTLSARWSCQALVLAAVSPCRPHFGNSEGENCRREGRTRSPTPKRNLWVPEVGGSASDCTVCLFLAFFSLFLSLYLQLCSEEYCNGNNQAG